MLSIFYFLLVLRFGRCVDERSFETKTVRIGDNLKLSCNRRHSGSLVWIRVVSGTFPEVLGKTNGFETFDPRIKTRKERGAFVLFITEAKQSDTAVYYCIQLHVSSENLSFLQGTDLRVQGAADVASVPTSPADPEHPVHLQCSVLSHTVSQQCPEEECESCFTDGSPCLNCTREDSAHEYAENPERLSTVKCSFLKNISSSDTGTYFCALATCGAAVSGKLDTEVETWNEQKEKAVVYLLCSALAFCLVIIAILIFSMKNIRNQSHAPVAFQTNGTATVYLEGRQTDEDSLVYSAPTFRRNSKAGPMDPKTEEEENIYSGVRFLEMD